MVDSTIKIHAGVLSLFSTAKPDAEHSNACQKKHKKLVNTKTFTYFVLLKMLIFFL